MTIEKSHTFFLIHNYNTVPDNLLKYCEDYLIVDASDDGRTAAELDEGRYRVRHVSNTGHNLTTYFSFFAEQYETLPEVILLAKGNLIGRHVSEEYFQRVYQNTWFTYLYEEKHMRPRYSKPTAETLRKNGGKDPSAGCIASLVSENQYLELNSSWYMGSENHPRRYFSDYDELLMFIYRDPVIPKNILFSPGGCYIVRREQILLHSPVFYRNLNKIMNYTLEPGFPAEAFMIERMLPTILEQRYEVNEWMESETEFDRKLAEQKQKLQEREKQAKRGKLSRLKDVLKRNS